MSIRVAVLSDIHGNMPALDAVVAEIAELRPDEILVGGDLVGRGPEGSRVVRRIRELGWPSVRGNHEDYLLDFRRRRVPEEWWDLDEWAASRWMAAELSDSDVAYIEALPMTLRPESAPGLRLVHGSPAGHSDGLGPWSSDPELADHLEAIDEGLLVCAHTHRPMVRELPTGRVINVGSVGLPFNGDRRAQYALFTFEDGEWTHDLRRVDYDVGETLAIYEKSGFLAAGGVTARLLKMELEDALPYLVPFLLWTRALGERPAIDRIDAFLDFYGEDEPLASFYRRLKRLRREVAAGGGR